MTRAARSAPKAVDYAPRLVPGVGVTRASFEVPTCGCGSPSVRLVILHRAGRRSGRVELCAAHLRVHGEQRERRLRAREAAWLRVHEQRTEARRRAYAAWDSAGIRLTALAGPAPEAAAKGEGNG